MITIGITTYNRKRTLEMMSKSFYSSNLTENYNIRVYDDASTEFDKEYLRKIFPNAKSIYVHKQKQGADKNMRYMYEDFIHTDDEFFFNADSDLLFHKEWLNTLMMIMNSTDGIISAFNAVNSDCSHKHRIGYSINGVDVVEKESIGAAGTMFRRDIVALILEELKEYDDSAFDWKWSDVLKKNDRRILTLKNSKVQHIGFIGYNSCGGGFDYGDCFEVDCVETGQFINDTLRDYAIESGVKTRNRIPIFPFSIVEKGSRVIIYGAGKYGMDYYNQILVTGYCEIVAICDQNYLKMEGITRPEAIEYLDYDYIVVSVNRDDMVEEIVDKLLEMNIPMRKIITGSKERLITIS